MTSTITDRVYGESASVAVKAPCLSVSVGVPLPLVGLGAIGGYVPNPGDRILVKDQVDPTTNGIYNASAGTWARSGDFNGIYDAVQGTLIVVYFPNGQATMFQLTTANPIIGTTSLNFSSFINPTSLTYNVTPAEITAGAVIINNIYPSLTVDRYATNAIPGTTDMTAAIKMAWNVAKAQGGGVISFIKGAIYALTSVDAVGPINLPNQNSNGSITTQAVTPQVYCLGGSNITFDFAGAQLKSTMTGLVNGSTIGILFDNCQGIRLISPNMNGTQVQGGGVVSLGAITPGAGYVNGTYTNVIMTGGTGTHCCCTIVVAGGAVTSCVPTYPGGSTTASLAQGYQIGDVLSTPNANLGGAGAGFSVPVTSSLGAGNIVATAACIPFAVTSLSGQSSNITTYDLTATNCFAGFWAIDGQANGLASFGISLLGHTSVINGEYGIPLHNSGDGTYIENLYTYRVNRPHFFYGVQGATIARGDFEQINYAFSSIIKSYSRSTSGISINALYRNAPGSTTPRLAIQVQCDPGVIAIPPTVKNLYIKHDEFNMAPSSGIEFDYFAGAGGTVQTATSANQLFDQIWLQGFCNGFVFSTVSLTTAAAQCQINYDNLESAWATVYGGATDIRNGLGFISSRTFFSTMTLTFGGTTVAGTAIAVDTSISDGLCKVKGICTLTAKNGAGAAALILPFKTRQDATANALGVILGVSGMVGLQSAPIVGSLIPNSNVMSLVQQSPTNIVAVADTNFSVASVLNFDITYPI